MKCFIGFGLSGRSATVSRMIADDISSVYFGPNVLEKYPPHITFKITVDITKKQFAVLVDHLSQFANSRKKIKIKLARFGRFPIGVIYREVWQDNLEVNTLQRELCESLVQFPWITFKEVEPNGIPHLTVAEGDFVRDKFEPIYNYVVNKYSNKSDLVEIDHIDLFTKRPRKQKWVISKKFKFN